MMMINYCSICTYILLLLLIRIVKCNNNNNNNELKLLANTLNVIEYDSLKILYDNTNGNKWLNSCNNWIFNNKDIEKVKVDVVAALNSPSVNPDDKDPTKFRCYVDPHQFALIDLNVYYDDGTEVEYKKK